MVCINNLGMIRFYSAFFLLLINHSASNFLHFVLPNGHFIWFLKLCTRRKTTDPSL